MAEKQAKDTKYQYALNSNLVLQGQSGPRGPVLPSGEGETLKGRKLASFGDRATREKAPEDTKLGKRKIEAQVHGMDLGKRHKNETHNL